MKLGDKVSTPLGIGYLVGDAGDEWLVKLCHRDNLANWIWRGSFVFRLVSKGECEVRE